MMSAKLLRRRAGRSARGRRMAWQRKVGLNHVYNNNPWLPSALRRSLSFLPDFCKSQQAQRRNGVAVLLGITCACTVPVCLPVEPSEASCGHSCRLRCVAAPSAAPLACSCPSQARPLTRQRFPAKLSFQQHRASSFCRTSCLCVPAAGPSKTWAEGLLNKARVLIDMPSLAQPDAMLMSDTALQNTFTCQPQQRNIHGRVFGGFLMRSVICSSPAALLKDHWLSCLLANMTCNIVLFLRRHAPVDRFPAACGVSVCQ